MNPRVAGQGLGSGGWAARLCVASVAFCLLLAGADARAQPVGQASRATDGDRDAKALFARAMELRTADKCAEAVALFEESRTLASKPGTLYYLADCLGALGRLVRAQATFREAADLASRLGKAALANDASERAAAMDGRTPRLLVQVPAELRGLHALDVTLDERPLPPSEWNVLIAVDPGEHVVRVHAPGMSTRTVTVAAPAEKTTIAVAAAPLDEQPVAVPPPAPAPAPVPPLAAPAGSARPAAPRRATGPAGVSSAELRPNGDDWHPAAALALSGVGVLGLGAGVTFGVLSMNSNADWERETAAHCDARLDCDSAAAVDAIRGIESERAAFGAASTVAFVVAGAALAGGAVVWLTRPAPRAGASIGATLRIVPKGPHGTSLVLRY